MARTSSLRNGSRSSILTVIGSAIESGAIAPFLIDVATCFAACALS